MALSEERYRARGYSRGEGSEFKVANRKQRLSSRGGIPVQFFSMEREFFSWGTSSVSKSYVRRVEAQAKRSLSEIVNSNSKTEKEQVMDRAQGVIGHNRTLHSFALLALVFAGFSCVLSLIGFVFALSSQAYQLLPITLGGSIFFLIVAAVFLKLRLKLGDQATDESCYDQSGIII